MVKIGEVCQLLTEFYLAKELKFRGMTSGLGKLKLRAATQVQDDLGHRSEQKPNYQNWNIRSKQGNPSGHDLHCWTP